jgi:hypothetical protein
LQWGKSEFFRKGLRVETFRKKVRKKAEKKEHSENRNPAAATQT